MRRRVWWGALVSIVAVVGLAPSASASGGLPFPTEKEYACYLQDHGLDPLSIFATGTATTSS